MTLSTDWSGRRRKIWQRGSRSGDRVAVYLRKLGTLAEEMETTSLYLNAASSGVKALNILTVSDRMITHEQTTQEERQTAFTQMVEIALDIMGRN